ncbi:hypothetical protein LINPERPRIM_LOCUS25239, partial [Linum perenne]
MMLFQEHIMHTTRKKNQGEYVIMALGQKPKGCIVGPLLLLGPRNHPTQPSQVGRRLVRRSWSTWTNKFFFMNHLDKQIGLSPDLEEMQKMFE